MDKFVNAIDNFLDQDYLDNFNHESTTIFNSTHNDSLTSAQIYNSTPNKKQREPNKSTTKKQLIYSTKRVQQNHELEARIKGPILNQISLDRLLESYEFPDEITYLEKRNRVIGLYGAFYRSIDNGPIIFKSKVESVKFYDDWFSLVLSTEEEVEEMTLVSRYFADTLKTRWSQPLENGKLRLDVTQFNNVFQVEIEMLEKVSGEVMWNHIQKIISILQDSPLYISRKRYELVLEIVRTIGISNHKYQKPKTLTYLHLQEILSMKLGKNNAKLGNQNSVNQGKLDNIELGNQNSVNQGKLDNIELGNQNSVNQGKLGNANQNNIWVTPKKDGYRFFIIIFNGMVYSVDTTYRVRLLSNSSAYTSSVYYVIDTELVGDTYYAFDVVLDKELESRLEVLDKLLPQLPINIVRKEYVQLPRSNQIPFLNNYWNKIKTDSNDGIIFVYGSYWDSVYKWKPDPTVDLYVDENGLTTPLELNVGKNIPSGVCEFSSKLEFIRLRVDKERSNSEKIVRENLEAAKLSNVWNGVSCFLMRKFHSKVKRNLIKKYCSSTLVDVGTGQGGDINKWLNLKHVYCIEPNKEIHEEFKKRVSGLSSGPRITLIKHRTSEKLVLSKLDKISTQNHENKVDTISLFFCINQFTQEDLVGLKNIIQKCKPNYIIGTYMSKPKEDYSSDCFEIKKLGDNQYNIHIKQTRINLVENVFNFREFRKSLAGYELIERERLISDKLSVEERKLSSMFRSFVFCKKQ